jgi:hypothetical protein
MRRFTLEIGRTELGGTHLNLVDENGRETGAMCLGELIEQITVLAMAEGWPPRRPELYPMWTPQQQLMRRALRAARPGLPLPPHSV